MGEQKRKEQREPKFIFTKKNYQVMAIGLGVIALGLSLIHI